MEKLSCILQEVKCGHKRSITAAEAGKRTLTLVPFSLHSHGSKPQQNAAFFGL